MKRVKTNIYKIKSGKFQVKLRGTDKCWITEAFETLIDAELFLIETKRNIQHGVRVTNDHRRMQLSILWKEFYDYKVGLDSWSDGWAKDVQGLYRNHLLDQIGDRKVSEIISKDIAKVLEVMKGKEIGFQQRQHVYRLMRQLFEYAVEESEILMKSPVKNSQRPKREVRETAKYLTVNESMKLLNHCNGKPYDTAVWLGLFLGLRAGEIIALKWSDIDFDAGRIMVCRNFDKKMKVFNDYTKNGSINDLSIPSELLNFLKRARPNSTSEYVATSPRRLNSFMSYDGFLKAVSRYCRELEITVITPHGLRHSTSSIYTNHGATIYDMKKVYNHRSQRSTERYMHTDELANSSVTNVINRLRLVTA